MNRGELKAMHWRKLSLDPQNPRLDEPVDTSEEAFEALMVQHGDSIFNLAKSIVTDSYVPTRNLIVTREEDGSHIVRDGNRATSAMRLIFDPKSAEKHLSSIRRNQLSNLKAGKDIGETMSCLVFRDGLTEDALKAMAKDHQGEQEGSSKVDWKAINIQRFKERYLKEYGRYWKASLVFDWLKEIAVITGNAPSQISSLERLLAQDFTNRLGIRFSMVPSPRLERAESVSEDTVAKVLGELFEKIISSQIRVDQIKTKEVRDRLFESPEWAALLPDQITGKYVEVFSRPVLPEAPNQKTESMDASYGDDATSDSTAKAPRGSAPGKTVGGARNRLNETKYVIARTTQIPINENRPRQIFNELRKLSPDTNPIACIVLLRTLLEDTIYYYSKTFGLTKFEIETKSGSKTVKHDESKGLAAKTKYVYDDAIKKAATNALKPLDSKEKRVLDDIQVAVDHMNETVHGHYSLRTEHNARALWNIVHPVIHLCWDRIANAQPQSP